MSSKDEFKDKIPVKSKVAYGSANTASSILSGIGLSAITFFYNVKLGLDAELIGIGWLIFPYGTLSTIQFSDIFKIEPELSWEGVFPI